MYFKEVDYSGQPHFFFFPESTLFRVWCLCGSIILPLLKCAFSYFMLPHSGNLQIKYKTCSIIIGFLLPVHCSNVFPEMTVIMIRITVKRYWGLLGARHYSRHCTSVNNLFNPLPQSRGAVVIPILYMRMEMYKEIR